MHIQTVTGTGSNRETSEGSSVKHNGYGYLILNVGILFAGPLVCSGLEHLFDQADMSWELIAKWFVFWVIGIRLFTAGISQASNPEFTGMKIFRFKYRESFVVIRELGFANMSLGVMGILSVLNDQWRLIAAISGGLFLGLAGIQHSIKKPDSRNEWIALGYDLIAFLVLLFYVVFR